MVLLGECKCLTDLRVRCFFNNAVNNDTYSGKKLVPQRAVALRRNITKKKTTLNILGCEYKYM